MIADDEIDVAKLSNIQATMYCTFKENGEVVTTIELTNGSEMRKSYYSLLLQARENAAQQQGRTLTEEEKQEIDAISREFEQYLKEFFSGQEIAKYSGNTITHSDGTVENFKVSGNILTVYDQNISVNFGRV